MFCDPIRQANGRWRCVRCGFSPAVPLARPFVKDCAAVEPSLLSSLVKVSAAAATWAASGWQTRPIEEVQRIYREACEPCEHFRPDGSGAGACGLCDCRLSPVFDLMLNVRNKIGWATESCPAGKWAATAREPSAGCGGCAGKKASADTS